MGSINILSSVTLTGLTALMLAFVGNPAASETHTHRPTPSTESQSLVKLRSTSTSRGDQPTYYFTIRNPEQAKPIKAITVFQDENIETVQFKNSSSRAYSGLRAQRKQERSLLAIGGDLNPGAAVFVFEHPVQPGATVTLSIKPERNPHISGTYLFRVTSYADPMDPGLSLGYGRLNITNR